MASNIKIKTVEQLEELLVQDLAWRKKEMISLKILVEKDKVNEPILLRAGIALLCAHFEGFIKRASNCYVGYVSQQKKLYSELKENFTALKMEKEFKSCSKSDKHSVHKKLLILHKELLTKRFIEKYDENNPFISTHSNPSSAELEEILETIGIESDIFETKATYIDSSLLEKRHKVVHGERSDLDKEDFLTTFKIIIDLVEEYKTLLVNAADNNIVCQRKTSQGHIFIDDDGIVTIEEDIQKIIEKF